MHHRSPLVRGAAVLVVAAIVTAGWSHGAAAEGIGQDGKLFKAAHLAAVAASEMQVETELAVVLAASEGDPQARQEWEDQAPSSDEAMEAMREQFRSLDRSALDDVTQSSLSLISRTSDSPRTARSIVGGGVTDWPAALEVYENISGSFVEAAARLANSVTDPDLRDATQSWSLAVQIEADVARQRSRLTGVFTDNAFILPEGDGAANDTSYENFLETVRDEEAHVRTLDEFGEPEVVDEVRNALSGNEVAAADDLRQQAINGQDSTDLGVDVDVWRDASGRKLARIHDAQVQIADSIRARAAQDAVGTEGDPVIEDRQRPFVAGAVVILLIAAGLAFLAGRRAGRSVRPREPLEG
jgi:hypothetical protein